MNCNSPGLLRIKKIVNGGYGLTHDEGGRTLLTRFCLPEEELKATVIQTRKNHGYAEATTILKAHPGRINPPCPYYTACGGCNLQHGGYPTQLELKYDILKDLLSRSGSTILKDFAGSLAFPMASPDQFNYRQRLRLQLNSEGLLGFKRFRSTQIIPVSDCLLAAQPLNQCLKRLNQHKMLSAFTGFTDEVEILLNPLEENLCLLLHTNRKPRPADMRNARQLTSRIGLLTRVFFTGRNFARQGPYTTEDTRSDALLQALHHGAPPQLMSWEVGGFCQVNLKQNDNLIKLLLTYSQASSTTRILDLYCGMGNFSLPLAQTGATVHGIESQGASIRSARRNAENNNLPNLSFTKQDVYGGSLSLLEHEQRFDLVLCDPPRQGLGKLVALLDQLSQKRLIYISCDPATLCRDLVELLSRGFRLTHMQPVDMFPQTHHVECVAVLEKH